MDESTARRFIELEKSHKEMGIKLEENTSLTRQIQTDTAELVAIFKGAKTGVGFLFWLGKTMKWVASFIVAITAIWLFYNAIKNGGNVPPHLPRLD